MVLRYHLVRRLCGFSSFWLKRHWVKKDPSWYCGTVPLQEPVGGFSSGRGLGANANGCLLQRENFKFKSSEMGINASKTANSNIKL